MLDPDVIRNAIETTWHTVTKVTCHPDAAFLDYRASTPPMYRILCYAFGGLKSRDEFTSLDEAVAAFNETLAALRKGVQT